LIPLNARMLVVVALVLSVGAFLAASPASLATEQPSSPSPVGRWVTGPAGGVVEIDRCGAAALCGRIVGVTLDHPGDPEPTDFRGRPLCGLTIITNAEKTDVNEWTGYVTDPRNGNTYHARLSLDESGRLHMRGYVGLPLFGETVIWEPFQGSIADRCLVVAKAHRQRAVE
jgi:uncharacterized protein (DUF2147 family)